MASGYYDSLKMRFNILSEAMGLGFLENHARRRKKK